MKTCEYYFKSVMLVFFLLFLTTLEKVNAQCRFELISGSATQYQNVCTNQSIKDMVFVFSSEVTDITISGLPDNSGLEIYKSNDTLYISGTCTIPGTYNNVVITPIYEGCSWLNAIYASLTVHEAPGVELIGEIQPQCEGSPIDTIRYRVVGGATGGIVRGLTPGMHYEFVTNTELIIYGDANVSPGQDTIFFTIETWGAAGTCTERTFQQSFIEIIKTPDIDIQIDGGSDLCLGMSQQLTVNLSGGVWSSLTPEIITITSNGKVTPISEGTARIQYQYTDTESGCVSYEVVEFQVYSSATFIRTGGDNEQIVCQYRDIQTITYNLSEGEMSAIVTGLPEGVVWEISNNTLTISGSPQEYGIFEFTVTFSSQSGCAAVPDEGILTVTEAPIITLISPPETRHQLVCVDQPIDTMIFVTSGALGMGYSKPSWMSIPLGIDTLKFFGTPSEAGTFTLWVTATGQGVGCTWADSLYTIIVNPLPDLDIRHASICLGGTLDLNDYVSTTTGDKLLFFTDIDGHNPVVDPQNITNIMNDTVFYIQSVMNTTECGSVLSALNINVYPFLEINVQDLTVCEGVATDLYEAILSSTADTILFFTDPDGTLPVSNPTMLIEITEQTTYYIKGINQITGCESLLMPFTVYVTSAPKVMLTSVSSNDTVCENLPITDIKYTLFNATQPIVSGLPSGVVWNLENDILTISGAPDENGYFQYIITVESEDIECEDIKIHVTGHILVNPKPAANFLASVDPENLNNNLIVGFTDKSQIVLGNIIEWNWNFGDGATASTQNPIHNYTTSDSYKVTLIVTSDKGCVDTISEMITTNENVIVNFSVNDTIQCLEGNSFQFANNTIVEGSTMEPSYFWNFDDGQTSILQNPVHSYQNPGNYTVSLTVSVGESGIYTHAVIISVHSTPKAIITPITICESQIVELNNGIQISTGDSLVFYSNAIATQVLADINIDGLTSDTIFYAKVFDIQNGCSSNIYSIPVTVIELPQIEVKNIAFCDSQIFNLITAITNGSENMALHFYEDAGQINRILNYTDFKSDISPVTIYVKAISTINDCETPLQSFVLTVSETPALSVKNLAICKGSTINLFDAVESYTGDTIMFYSDSQGSISIYPELASVTQSTSYYVRTINTETECESSLSEIKITVHDIPEITIESLTELCINDTYILAAQPPMGEWLSLTPDIATIDHNGIITPVSEGKAIIRYIITTDEVCTDTAWTTINILPAPVVEITNVENICESAVHILSATPEGGEWRSLNENIALVDTNGEIIPVNNGTVIIQYIAFNSQGCSDTAQTSFTILPVPVAEITGERTICENEQLHLTAVPQGGSWLSSTPEIAFITEDGIVIPITNGQAVIQYIARNEQGCYDTAQVTFTILETPLIEISDVRSICENQQLRLEATPWGGTWVSLTPEIVSVDITGDITIHSGGTAIVQYMTTNEICVDTAEITFNILPAPIAQINNIINTDLCTNSEIILSATPANGSWVSLNPIIAETDNLGKITALSSGDAIIQYIVTNEYGCSDTAQIELNIHPISKAEIGSILQLCENGKSVVIATPTGGSWSSLTPEIFTVDTLGNLLALAQGEAIIQYIITNEYGCSDTAKAAFVINPSAKIKLAIEEENHEQILCHGNGIDTIRYIVTGASNLAVIGLPEGLIYTWNENILTISGTPIDTGNYIFTIIAGEGTEACPEVSVNGAIKVNPVPSIILNEENADYQDICLGNEIQPISYTIGFSSTETSITGLPEGVYYNINNDILIIDGIPSEIGTFQYTVTSISENGECTSGIVHGTITVHALPMTTVNSTGFVCLGESTDITISLSGTAPWKLVISDGLQEDTLTDIQTPSFNYSVTPDSSSVYIIRSVFDAYCEASNTDTIFVGVRSIGIEFIGDVIVCEGEPADLSFTFTGNSEAPWTLVLNEGFQDTIITGIMENPYILTVVHDVVTEYTVISISDEYCEHIAIPELSRMMVSPLQAVAAEYETTICVGQTTHINGIPEHSMAINETPDIILLDEYENITGKIPGIAKIKYIINSEDHCTDSLEIILDVIPLPELIINEDNITLCPDSETNLTVETTGTIIEWFSEQPAIASVSNEGIVTANSAGRTLIYVVATNENFCFDTTTIEVYVMEMDLTINVSDQVYCDGESVPEYAFGFQQSGTTYYWERLLGHDFGLTQTEGIGSIPAFTATNTGIYPLLGFYRVYGESTESNTVCRGNDKYFYITVNPVPQPALMGDRIYCNGTLIPESTITESLPYASYIWSRVEGQSLEGVPDQGVNVFPAFIAVNNGTEILQTTYNLTADYSYANRTCNNGDTNSFTITLLPEPYVEINLAHQTICSGEELQSIEFTGIATRYKWERTAGNIPGLASSGEGNISAQILENFGTSALEAEYKVTPIFEYNGITCEGSLQIFTISVNPIPVIFTMPDMIYCAGSRIRSYTFGNTTGVVYTWEHTGGEPVGLPENGNGPLPAFTATNITQHPITAEYTVTALFTEQNTSCMIQQQFEIIVIPSFDFMANLPDQLYCNNIEVLETDIHNLLTLQGMPDDVQYNWHIAAGSDNVGLEIFQGVNIVPAFTATNPNGQNSTAIIVIEPQIQNCSEISFSYTIKVVPTPQLINVTDSLTVCSEEIFYYEAESSVTGTSISWVRRSNPAINNGQISSGTSAIINESLINNTNEVISVIYEFSLTSEDCTISTFSLLEVFVVPAIGLSFPGVINVCNGQTQAVMEYISNIEDIFHYELFFNDKAKNEGFIDISKSTILPANQININMPTHVTAGVYHAELLIFNEFCTKYFNIAINISDEIRITRQPQIEGSLCDGISEINLSVGSIGSSLTYQWHCNENPISEQSDASLILPYTQELNGEYYVVLGNACGEEMKSESVFITSTPSMIESKWDDVLFVRDEQGKYTYYQWYKDGMEVTIDGYSQYYTENGGLNGTYMVRAYYNNSKYDESCPYNVSTDAKYNVSVFPNPVISNQNIKVRIDAEDLTDIPCNIEICDILGRKIYMGKIDDHITEVPVALTSGNYILHIVSTSGKKSVHQFVVK